MYKMLFLISVIFLSCKKQGDLNGPYLVPHSLFFILKHNGQRLPDSTLDNLKFFYLKDDNTKNFIDDFQRGTGDGRQLGIMTSRNIGILSAKNGIKNYYLQFPNGDIDTLLVNYQYLSRKEADTSACYCFYPLYEVLFNGNTARLDSQITLQTVYEFDK